MSYGVFLAGMIAGAALTALGYRVLLAHNVRMYAKLAKVQHELCEREAAIEQRERAWDQREQSALTRLISIVGVLR